MSNRTSTLTRRLVLPAAIAVSLATGVSVMSQTGAAEADTTQRVHFRAPAAVVPDGMAWIQGFVTDQAGHKLDNVNVEVWPADPTATEPIASNLSYAGVPADKAHAHGVFRLEVPVNEPYRIVFSAVGGAEDGDAFRMKEYGAGRAIVVRPHTGARAQADQAGLVAGRVRDLGTVALVHRGRVASKVTAKAGKVEAGERGKLKIRVTSPFVRDTTGPVVISVNGKRFMDKLVKKDHGTMTTKLPKLRETGTYHVKVRYLGSKTVKHDKSKPAKLKVVEPKTTKK